MHVTQTRTVESLIGVLCCPRCQADLELREDGLQCSACRDLYPIDQGIPLLFAPNSWDDSKRDVTSPIRSFYEEHPFPDYDDFDSVATLIEKARKGVFAKLLDDQVPPAAHIIDVGCGTGQLTNFLSIANRTVIGTDLSLSSLRMGQAFKEQNDLKGAHFVQMNLFRPCFKPASFDLAICNGVLHHTSDPWLGFRTIATLVKPGGYLLVGLYHKYGRLLTDIRRMIFRFTRDRMKALDPRVVSSRISSAKRNAWFMDQYKNPHESKHTIGEALSWLEEAGFTFVKSIPKTVPFQRFEESESLFEPDRPGNRLQRGIREAAMAFTGSREGGFFIVIGRKSQG